MPAGMPAPRGASWGLFCGPCALICGPWGNYPPLPERRMLFVFWQSSHVRARMLCAFWLFSSVKVHKSCTILLILAHERAQVLYSDDTLDGIINEGGVDNCPTIFSTPPPPIPQYPRPLYPYPSPKFTPLPGIAPF
jgi:hypothetical protein